MTCNKYDLCDVAKTKPLKSAYWEDIAFACIHHVCTFGDGGGGDSFFASEDVGSMFDSSFPACALFFFFLHWILAGAHQFHS